MPLLKKHDFYNTFFQKNKIPTVFAKLFYKYNDALFYSSKNHGPNTTAKVNFISLLPQYLYPELANTKAVAVKQIQQKKLDGFGILIDGVKNADNYLSKTFKSSTRGPIKKKINRLESCFNIHSKMFYGAISETDYLALMPQLRAMIERRFIQRNTPNEALGKWQWYLDSTLAQINNKEASLYVLYAGQDIIGMSLNYHIHKVFIGHIIAYDIDYSKFGLGNTIVYNLLEWSIKNNYAIFDMGNGALDYKRIWSNFAYNYQYFIVYAKRSFSGLVLGQLQVLKVRFKNILKAYHIVDSFRKAKTRFFIKNKQVANLSKSFKFAEITKDDFKNIKPTIIGTGDAAFETIKKTVIDFVYAQQDHINDIELFKIHDTSFIIKGTKRILKITIH